MIVSYSLLNTHKGYVYYSWIKVCSSEYGFTADKSIPLLQIMLEIVPEIPSDRYIVVTYDYGRGVTITIYSDRFYSPLDIGDISAINIAISYDTITILVTNHESDQSVYLPKHCLSLDDPSSLLEARNCILDWCAAHGGLNVS